jgi:hypothetical protein
MNNENYVDYYDQILQFFHNKPPKKRDVEIWKNQTYVKLMEALKKTKDKQKIRNSIILLLSLFEDLPPDILNTRGDESKNLKKEEKKKLVSLLKEEYT